MAPFTLDIDALSGVCGSISIACWVVVFSPQIIENFRRSSAEGLSVEFVIIWLAGDIFNILGSVLQNVLPTMLILAIYYTLADIVLLGQCFYYRGFTLRDPNPAREAAEAAAAAADREEAESDGPSERTPLVLANQGASPRRPANAADVEPTARSRSQSSFHDHFANLDGTHMSPAVPFHPQHTPLSDAEALQNPPKSRSLGQAILFNGTSIILVVLAGVAGYYLSSRTPEPSETHDKSAADDQAQSLQFSLWGQIFGYICAVLYLGSRVPQLLLNYRRKSTEGLNALFFLFACIGNLTYVLSILAFAPICSKHAHGHWQPSHCRPGEAQDVYGRYILVNLSWLIGSLGTLFLDAGVFAQFWVYRGNVQEPGLAAEDVPRGMDGEGRGREPNER
ncbi:hypothetical protein LTR08_004670 [Meristemomyces frigidus]|nr:hypothetical protein LTR08_004670 [Meristemomyces frigidus]